jgi:hypothetical protein
MPNSNDVKPDNQRNHVTYNRSARTLDLVGRVLVVVFTVLAGIAALGIWLHPKWDPFGLKKGRLEALPPLDNDGNFIPASSIKLVADDDLSEEQVYDPWGPNLATVVDFKNPGVENCVLRRAEYTWTQRFKTPKRQTKCGAVKMLSLNLYRPIVRGARIYRRTLRPPLEISGDDYVSIELAVIDKRNVGWSYKGTLTLTFDNNQIVTVENVIVDLLAEAPPPISSLDDCN